jgi:hypothetical protein
VQAIRPARRCRRARERSPQPYACHSGSYAPSWESYIKQINDKITAKHNSKSRAWKKQEPFYRDLMGDLQSMKLAWRNPTMHIVRRYECDEAEEIFKAMSRFVNRLGPALPKSEVEKLLS